MVLFGDGNTWLAVAGASVLLWLVHTLVLRGVQTAAVINMVTTIAKLIPLLLFILCALISFKWDTFIFDFTGLHFGEQHDLLSRSKVQC